MPERPSLEAQIDDDEAWLAANDDDDWDAPAAPAAPPPRSRRPLQRQRRRRPRSRHRRARRRRRSARSTRRSPRPRSAFMIWRAIPGGRSRAGGGSTCVWWKSEIRGNCAWRRRTRKETSWPSRSTWSRCHASVARGARQAVVLRGTRARFRDGRRRAQVEIRGRDGSPSF